MRRASRAPGCCPARAGRSAPGGPAGRCRPGRRRPAPAESGTPRWTRAACEAAGRPDGGSQVTPLAQDVGDGAELVGIGGDVAAGALVLERAPLDGDREVEIEEGVRETAAQLGRKLRARGPDVVG